MTTLHGFIPDPAYTRGQHRPYQSMWRSPIGVAFAWGLAGIGLAAWVWWKAPELDDRPELPHID
jgi:hypothetical protein